MNGHDIAKALYQPTRKKKRKRKQIEKVTAPDHWRKDFDSHKLKLKQSKTMSEIITKELRKQLKELVKTELEQLPEYLKDMEPKERLDILLKMMPFVLPKVKGVNHSLGEPDDFWN